MSPAPLDRTGAPARAPSLVGFFLAAALLSALAFLPQVWASYAGAARVPAPVRSLQLLLFFGPALLAILWTAREEGRAGVARLLRRVLRWRVHPAWYLAVLLGQLVLIGLALALARAAGATATGFPAPARLLQAFLLSFGAYAVLNTEELAWRGYAWPRLRDRLGALRASLVLGVIWGLLHLPLFLVRGGHPGGWPLPIFLAMTIAYSVLFALVYEGTGGSILLVHLLHQAINAWGDVLPFYPRAAGSVLPAVIVVALSIAIAVIGVGTAGWRWAPAGAGTRSAGRLVA